jgi:hypothetical protein
VVAHWLAPVGRGTAFAPNGHYVAAFDGLEHTGAPLLLLLAVARGVCPSLLG